LAIILTTYRLAGFDSQAWLSHGDKSVNAESIMVVVLLEHLSPE
jgi:phosphotransferase system HPr-like phosphotransfer protein